MVVTLAASCSYGLKLDDGHRQLQTFTHVNFLFSDGESSVQHGRPSPPPEKQTAMTIQTSSAFSAEPVALIEFPSSEPVKTTAQPARQLTKATDVSTENNKAAQALAIPIAEIDPSLQLFIQDSDPSQHISADVITTSGLVGFYLSGARREPTIQVAPSRPLHVVQRVFVHVDDKGASIMYELLKNEAVQSFTKAAVEFFQQPYPDLEASSRSTSQFNLSEENHLFEIRLDPQIPAQDRLLGPGDPHVYYLVLRQGRVTTLIELFYLDAQDPETVAILGERFVQRAKTASLPSIGA